jgi:hypothetical protein
MGAITQKIFDLLSEGSNIEQSRSTGIIIHSNWFDAIDGEADPVAPGREESKGADPRNVSEGRDKDLTKQLRIDIMKADEELGMYPINDIQ